MVRVVANSSLFTCQIDLVETGCAGQSLAMTRDMSLKMGGRQRLVSGHYRQTQ